MKRRESEADLRRLRSSASQGINEDNVWTDYEGYDPENLGDDPERGIYR